MHWLSREQRREAQVRQGWDLVRWTKVGTSEEKWRKAAVETLG